VISRPDAKELIRETKRQNVKSNRSSMPPNRKNVKLSATRARSGPGRAEPSAQD